MGTIKSRNKENMNKNIKQETKKEFTKTNKKRNKETKYEVKPLEFSWWSWDFKHWNNTIHITNMKTMRW